MFRTKKHFAIFSALLLAAGLSLSSAADSELIPEDEKGSDVVHYETVSPYYGDITKTEKGRCSVLFPVCNTVYNNIGRGEYVNTIVLAGQSVEAGDPLVEICAAGSEIELEEKTRALSRLRTAYSTGVTERQQAINKLSKEYAKMTDQSDYTAQHTSVRLQTLQTELSQYIFEQEYAIKTAEEELEKLEQTSGHTYITAPISGTVAGLTLTSFETGSIIEEGDFICTIIDKSTAFLKTDSALFSYGTEVTVTGTIMTASVNTTGTVVIDSRAIPEGVTKGFSLIQVDLSKIRSDFMNFEGFEPSWLESSADLMAEGTTAEYKNVLLIPLTARTSEKGVYSVTKMTSDGLIHTRRISVAAVGKETCWVISGVSEDDKLVIN